MFVDVCLESLNLDLCRHILSGEKTQSLVIDVIAGGDLLHREQSQRPSAQDEIPMGKLDIAILSLHIHLLAAAQSLSSVKIFKKMGPCGRAQLCFSCKSKPS